MKKLMILAAVAMTAAVSQAFSINWMGTNIGIPVAKDVTKSESGITTTTTSDKFAAGDLAVTLYWIDEKSIQHTIGDPLETTEAGKIATTIIGDGTSSDLYTAMVASYGTSWKPTVYATATYETADGVYEFSGSATSTKALSTLETGNVNVIQNFTKGSWEYTANEVPEPTSAMLLLLGVAGLALKRRRA